MNLLTTLKFIARHPLNKGSEMKALARFVRWQISTRLTPYPIIYSFTNKAKLVVQKGVCGATGNFYCGLYEFNDMSFLLHFLRKGDLFVDVGANIGSYTVLSAAHIEAETVAVEPVPSTYERLLFNIQLNQVNGRVNAINTALGSTAGKLHFTSKLGASNHVSIGNDRDQIEVNVDTLDNVLEGRSPVLLKVDVEGFETEVMRGAHLTLEKETLKAIIIELAGLGNRYGFDERKVHDLLIQHNFQPYTYDPLLRKLTHCRSYDLHNTIYVRDAQFVKERVSTAEKVRIRNKLV
ncbi:FkbM family methyltransferase [Chitinophaga japonensis]|uniref:FkbM family methyltransferase n=1 Tax=Chitinophaga japonensis TaxID=104662 RepID=A0A562T157_CHIJA|nr:FkbM family methyltransferase [Chitinophaga japonensis]TWI86924.1 FkbM family methyltransferase [Chitinophaga japonensis]